MRSKKLITEIDRYKELMGLSLLNESNFVHVVNGKKVSVTSPYGNRSLGWHHGIDLGTPSGTNILAPADGEVIESRYKDDRCGGRIYINHGTIDGKNIKTRYCHVKEMFVEKGDKVTQGQIIGLTGGGTKDKGHGRSTGPHLHWEVYENGSVVNPIDYYNNSVTATGTKTQTVDNNKDDNDDNLSDKNKNDKTSSTDIKTKKDKEEEKDDTSIFDIEGSFKKKFEKMGDKLLGFMTDFKL